MITIISMTQTPIIGNTVTCAGNACLIASAIHMFDTREKITILVYKTNTFCCFPTPGERLVFDIRVDAPYDFSPQDSQSFYITRSAIFIKVLRILTIQVIR